MGGASRTWRLSEFRSGAHEPAMADLGRQVFEAWPVARAADDGTDAFYFRQFAGARLGAHIHPKSDHYLTVLEGTAVCWVEGEGVTILHAGDVVNVPAGVLHDLQAGPHDDLWGVDLQTPRAGIEPTTFHPERDSEVVEAFDAASQPD